MARAQIIHDVEGDYSGIIFDCPGCEIGHHVVNTDWTPEGHCRSISSTPRPEWQFNGNLDLPTLSPSVKTWCEWGPERKKVVCHFFVKDGKIQFCSDSTHALAGQTVDLPEMEP